LFVDGVDECDDPEKLLPVLQALVAPSKERALEEPVTESGKVKILFSSRHPHTANSEGDSMHFRNGENDGGRYEAVHSGTVGREAVNKIIPGAAKDEGRTGID